MGRICVSSRDSSGDDGPLSSPRAGSVHDRGWQARVAGAAAVAPASARIQLPGGVLSSLPGAGHLLALTVDDGVNSDVLRAYAQFA
jgi:hypothetical protein